MHTLFSGAVPWARDRGAARPQRRHLHQPHAGRRAQGRNPVRTGGASAHAIYTTLALAGLDRVSGVVGASSAGLHLAGGLILVALGLRLSRRRPRPNPRSRTSAYVMTLAVGLGNPLTILYFTAAMAAGTIPAGGGRLLVVGVFLGSAVCVAALTSLTAALHRHLTERRLEWANRLTACRRSGPYGVLAMATAL